MTRRRRRRKKTAASEPATRTHVATERLDGMRPPNHMANLYEIGSDLNTFGEYRFPRVRLMKAEPGYGTPVGLVFVDDIYGLTHWAERDTGAPATWMDPEIFLRMALQDPELKTLAEDGVRKKSTAQIKKLEPALDRIFEEHYLVYLLERFASARPYLAEWVMAHYADQVESLDPKERTRFMRTRKTKSIPAS